MHKAFLHRSTFAVVLALGLGLPAAGQDAGTLDKEAAEQAFKGWP